MTQELIIRFTKLIRNVAHFHNRGWRNYKCLHLQFKIDVKY